MNVNPNLTIEYSNYEKQKISLIEDYSKCSKLYDKIIRLESLRSIFYYHSDTLHKINRNKMDKIFHKLNYYKCDRFNGKLECDLTKPDMIQCRSLESFIMV